MSSAEAQVYQPSRHALACLLLAQAFIILPHLFNLSLWLAPIWAASVVWRLQVYRGAWSLPPTWLKGMLALSSAAVLIFSFGQIFALEPLVALLVLAFTLKLLEIRHRKDVLLLILLGFFVAATQLLFGTALLAFLYTLLCFALLLAALLGLHQSEQGYSSSQLSWQTVKILLQALPLALLLFIIMPRMGSLWQLPMSQQAAKTGVSDSMSPGDINRLNKDNSPALRISFSDNKAPPSRELYWRGLVLSNFDGRRWSSSFLGRNGSTKLSWAGATPQSWLKPLIEYQQADSKRGISYQIMMEANHQPWLYALEKPLSTSNGVATTPQYNLLYKKPVSQRFSYQVQSFPQFSASADALAPWVERVETRLPLQTNPRSQALARQWRTESSRSEDIVKQAFSLFNQQFIYTLEPPLLGKQSIDDFLFDTQRGYCEHFASSFVFLMRAAGIPARVVVGYQGGQWNSNENYLLVSQSDAHAWAEVWISGKGWQRYDPTSAVAPERIELGFRSFIEQDSVSEQGAGDFAGFNQGSVFYSLGLRWDALNYSWQRWVLDYDSNSQSQLLAGMLGSTDYWRIGLLFIVGAGAIIALLGLALWWRGRPAPLTLELQLQKRLQLKLNKLGLERAPGETPAQLVKRAGQLHPELAPLLNKLGAINTALLYQPKGNDHQTMLRQSQRLLKSLKA